MAEIMFLVFNVIFMIGCTLGEVPSYIHVCGRRNPKLNDCVKDAVISLREVIKDGIPELDVPQVDPFILPGDIPLVDTDDLKALATDIKLYGFSNFRIDMLEIDLDNKKIDIGVHFDELIIEGEYDVATKILVSLNGKGPIEILVDGVDGVASLKFEIVNTKKGERMFFSSLNLKLKITDFSSKFVPKPGADTTFGEAITAIINDNRKEVAAAVQPTLEKKITAKILELSNTVCKKFTYDELFPDRE